MVRLLSVPMISTGFVSAFFFILYLYLSFRTKRIDKQHFSYLLFSILSLVNTIYVVAFSGIVNAGDNLELLNAANRITITTAMFVILLTLHFNKYHFDLPGKKDLVVFYAVNTLFTVIAWIDTPLFLAKKFYATSRYYTGLEFGILFKIWGIYVIAMMLYAIVALVRGYIANSRINQKKSMLLLLLLSASVVWYSFGMLDALTGVTILDFPPLTWIGSLLMILCIEIILVTTIENLHAQISGLYTQVIHDTATAVYSKSFFEMELERRLECSELMNASQYLVFVDVDNFKSVNDIHGHPCGDMVLKRIAEIIKSNLRQSDLVARYGGDEFIILMMNHGDIELAKKIIERIRQRVAEERFSGVESQFSVTCSFGIFPFEKSSIAGLQKNDLLAKADAALYESKRQGKNRVYTNCS